MPAQPTQSRCFASRGALWASVLACLALALFAAPAALAAPPNYKGASADGKVVFFETDEQLVPGDTDTKRDIYERSFDPVVGAYVTRQVSLGPTGGNDAYPALFEGVNASGSRVFFSTEETLTAADTDHRVDVYMRDLETGTTTLVSQGAVSCSPTCGNGNDDAGFARASADGTKAFFVTKESLLPEDTDIAFDIYVRDLLTETTTLVSVGEASCSPACGNGEFGAALRGLAPNASRVYFTTSESLSSADTDTAVDIYARNLNAGTTTLVSQGAASCAPACGNSGAAPVFQTSSADGSRVIFTTDEALTSADTDSATDVYARDLPGGPTTLVSAGSSSVLTASFAGASTDASKVFYSTAESLVPADTNTANDIYAWAGGAPILVSSPECAAATECGATFNKTSADGGTVIFSTAQQLSLQDGDSGVDIYSQVVGGGAPTLVSRPETGCAGCGAGNADSRFNRASSDASIVYFTSEEQLAAQDFDADDDIYVRDIGAGMTTLSTPPPGLCPFAACDATFVDATADGSHMYFQTEERLTAEDVDSEADVYERAFDAALGREVTRLVSTGNSSDLELGPAAPELQGTNPASPGSSTEPAILGQAEAGSAIKLYTNSNCSGEPAATGTAAQLSSPGLAVSVAAGSTTSFWATAEAEGIVSRCSNPISYTQQAATDGGGGSANGAGLGASQPPSGGGIVYVTPHTRITFAPAAKTYSADPIFRFTDTTGQPGTRFVCRLDRKRWKGCSSPLRLKRVSRGRHTFEVRAVNALGTWEPTPAQRRFKRVPR